MKKRIIGKGLAVAVILLFLGTCITPSVALDNAKRVSMSISNGNTLYIVGSGKPDLIVTNIWFRWNPWMLGYPFFYWIGVTIKNIGDEKIDENEDINISLIVKKWLFVRLETYDIIIKGGLEPGESKKSGPDYTVDPNYFPGFYKFESYVNPDKAIDESDYLNNDYTERNLYLIMGWIELRFLTRLVNFD